MSWDGKRALLTQGVELNRVLVEQTRKRNITIIDDVYMTDLLTQGNTVVGAVGVDVNHGEIISFTAKSVVIATGGWQRSYTFTSAPGGLTGAMHVAALRTGADLVNMEMVTFCPNVILWPPALRGDIFPYILIERFGDLLEKHGRPFLRDEYDPSIYRIATTTEWNKLIFSVAGTRVVLRGDGSPRGGTYYSIKTVPLNILEEAEKLYPGWKWLRTDFSSLMDWLEAGNAVEVAPAAHYMEGGILVDEHTATTLKGLYAAGECSGGLFGANRVASAITQILVQGAIAGGSAAEFSKTSKPKEPDKKKLDKIRSRLLSPFTKPEGVHAPDLKKRVRKIADDHLWVLRNGKGLKSAISELESILSKEIPKLSIQTAPRTYNKEWIDAIEIEHTTQVLLASARSALFRTESRGVHNRSDYPLTNNNTWLREIITRNVKGKFTLTTQASNHNETEAAQRKIQFRRRDHKSSEGAGRMNTIKVRVSRFDPAVDSAPRYQSYEVPFEARMTVMDVLDYIYENLDPTIAYHSHTSCHRRVCTRCNVTINSKPGLSCHTEVAGDITIDPLPRFKVVRDLVVEGL